MGSRRGSWNWKLGATLALWLGAALTVAGNPVAGNPVAGNPVAGNPVAEAIRHRLEHSAGRTPTVLEEAVHSTSALPTFYEERIFAPAWIRDGEPTPALAKLLVAVEGSDREGLEPDGYHREALTELLGLAREPRSRPSPARLADLDLLATDAFLILGAHLVSGRVDPESFDPEWIAVRREVDLLRALRSALESGDPGAILDSLLPEHPGYERLRDALRRYREIAAAGGWPPFPEGESLRLGDRDPRIPVLRRRLAITGDLDPEAPPPPEAQLFGEDLEAAVLAFQRRHGLDEDGVVGRKTGAALAEPVDVRIRQLELSLERWRWLPRDLGERHVIVNLPAFDLRAVDAGTTVLSMRVAVGRPVRRSPVFSDRIRYLVANPFWEVPHRLAVQDKLPEIRKDPAYLAELGFRVYPAWGEEPVELDPTTIDWASLSPSRFPYRLRQDPGPRNALGRVKMMFPNRFNVYLHDTPERAVFTRSDRDVSSGCIRLQHPVELAVWLLGGEPEARRAELEAAFAAGRETVVPLPSPVPVHLLYWTAWAEDDGTIHFRRDVYGRDAALADALASGPSPSAGEAAP